MGAITRGSAGRCPTQSPVRRQSLRTGAPDPGNQVSTMFLSGFRALILSDSTSNRSFSLRPSIGYRHDTKRLSEKATVSPPILSCCSIPDDLCVDITLTLTFIRCMQNPTTMPSSPTSSYSPTIPTLHSEEQVIDTQAPLRLSSSTPLTISLFINEISTQPISYCFRISSPFTWCVCLV